MSTVAQVPFWWIAAIIATALIFDFVNGFHDAANSIATVVSTRVLKPQWAVAWAAFFNFAAFALFELKVATTIGKGVIDPSIMEPNLIFSALMGAIIWDLVTWYFGIPSSSSHALIGGLVGAALGKTHSLGSLNWAGLQKIVASIVLSPVFGGIVGMLLMFGLSWLLRHWLPRKVDAVFRKLQLLSAAFYSLGHGGNDAQKTMGIISALLISSGYLQVTQGQKFDVPLWVVLSCHLAMGLGTLFGGWRIVKTMGMRITALKPVGGFCAEAAGATTLFLATGLGIPVSTTHTITGSIVGVGSLKSASAVRWGVARKIIWAWVLTIPMSAAAAWITWEIVRFFAAS